MKKLKPIIKELGTVKPIDDVVAWLDSKSTEELREMNLVRRRIVHVPILDARDPTNIRQVVWELPEESSILKQLKEHRKKQICPGPLILKQN